MCLWNAMHLIEINGHWGMRSFSVFCQRCEISVWVWESDSQHQHSPHEVPRRGYTFGAPGAHFFMWLSHHDDIKPHSLFLLLQRKCAYLSIPDQYSNFSVIMHHHANWSSCARHTDFVLFKDKMSIMTISVNKQTNKQSFWNTSKEILYRQSIKMSNYYNTDVLFVKCIGNVYGRSFN